MTNFRKESGEFNINLAEKYHGKLKALGHEKEAEFLYELANEFIDLNRQKAIKEI